MLNINKLSFSLLCFMSLIFIGILYISQVNSPEKKESKYESEIIILPKQCLQVMKNYRAGGKTWLIKFQNVCGTGVYANACIEELPGKFKLHKSGSKIPKFGNWSVYSYEGKEPVSIHVSSGPGIALIPGACGKEKG